MIFEIKQLEQKYKAEVYKIFEDEWGALNIVSRGKIFYADKLNGIIAVNHDEVLGFAFYNIENNECEIVALYSKIENMGIGSALINFVKNLAIENNCKRLFLMTTNDNIHGFAFYQKRGFTIAKIHVDAIKNSRKLKPQIPLVGANGIPIRDEIEFEICFEN